MNVHTIYGLDPEGFYHIGIMSPEDENLDIWEIIPFSREELETLQQSGKVPEELQERGLVFLSWIAAHVLNHMGSENENGETES